MAAGWLMGEGEGWERGGNRATPSQREWVYKEDGALELGARRGDPKAQLAAILAPAVHAGSPAPASR